MEIVIAEGTKYCIRLEATSLGQSGMSCLLTGGERPHIGGVAVVSDDETHSCQFSGHRDAEAALEVAEALHEKFSVPVAVTAGIHIDNATEEDIKRLRANWIKAVETLQ